MLASWLRDKASYHITFFEKNQWECFGWLQVTSTYLVSRVVIPRWCKIKQNPFTLNPNQPTWQPEVLYNSLPRNQCPSQDIPKKL